MGEAITVLAAGAPTFNPDATLNTARALLLGTASLALVLIGVVCLFGPGRQGNSGAVARKIAASVLSLVPLVIGVTVGAAAFGAAFLGWSIPGLTGTP